MGQKPSGRKRGGRKDSVSFWPPYPFQPRLHTLCLLVQRSIDKWIVHWEDQTTSEPFGTYAEFRSEMDSHPQGVDCYVGDIGSHDHGFPWLNDAIRHKKAKVICSRNGGIAAISIRKGRCAITIASLSKWTSEWEDEDPRHLADIRELCARLTPDHTSVFPSPSALGSSVMQSMWREPRGKRRNHLVSRPKVNVRDIILDNTIGGRVETYGPGKYDRISEIDLRSAYASCCANVPDGTCIFYPGSHVEGGGGYDYIAGTSSTFFARCVVRITEKVPVSPIGVRVGIRNGRGSLYAYPTEPETYGDEKDSQRHLWLWKEEIEAARELGIDVAVHEAYGWKRMNHGLLPWVARMESLRSEYESEGRPEQAKKVKKCIVSAIGRFGIRPETLTLVHKTKVSKGDEPFLYSDKSGFPFSYAYIHHEIDKNSPSPSHFYSYILMQCRLKMFHRELEEVTDGNEVIYSNFDSIGLRRSSQRPTGQEIGQWREKEYTEVTIPYPRAMVAREKTMLPGIKKDQRQKYT